MGGRRRQRVSAGQISVLGVVLSALLVWQGTTAGRAAADTRNPDRPIHAASSIGTWSFTRTPPPQAVSAAGGVRVGVVGARSDRRFRILRYDDSAAPVLVDTQFVAARGYPMEPYIDPSGTIVVIGHTQHGQFGLVWPEGSAPGPWTKVAGAKDLAWRASTVADGVGDLALIIPRTRDTVVVTWNSADGWSAPRHMADHDQSGALGQISLTDDGDLAGIASHNVDHQVTTTLLTMPLGASGWTKRTVLLSGVSTLDHGRSFGAQFDPSTGRSAAFVVYFRDGAMLAGVSTTAGTVTETMDSTFYNIWTIVMDPHGVARFVFSGQDGMHAVEYNTGWSDTSFDSSDRSILLSEASANGSILTVWQDEQTPTSIFALQWASGGSPVVDDVVASGGGQGGYDVTSLESLGLADGWIGCRSYANGLHPHVYAVLSPS